MTPRALAAALLFPLVALAQPTQLLNITDPEGDDVGDGMLVYPRDGAFSAGDLDLRSLRAYAEGSNLRFEATFRNPIRDPASARGPGLGSEDLSVFARRGFYAFNLDIYLDTDRVPGSGNTVSLPGRGAMIDPAHAWEKVIVLTPRPELMKRQFTDALLETSPANATDVAATMERSVFFATDVRVRGRTVSFTVPGSFVDAQTLVGSSLTAMVTLAKLSIETDVNLFGKAPGTAVERLTLGVAQPESGRPAFAMGYSGDRAPANAVVDLLSPDPRQQMAQLAPGGLLTGLNRDNKLGASQVILAAVPPAATVPAPSAPAGASWFARALGGMSALFGGGATTSAAAPSATGNPQSVQSLMAAQPAAATAGTPAVAAPAAAAVAPAPVQATGPATAAPARAAPATERSRARDAAFFEEQELRLRTLERLRKSGLISEAEFQQKRKDVLEGL